MLTLAAATLCLLAAAACGGGGGSTSGKAEISYLTFETPALTASFWDKAIAGAAKQVPGLTVKRLTSPNADRNAYAKQLQASGQFPDVLAGLTVNDFLGANLLAPYDKKWLADTFMFPDGTAVHGKTYMPPTGGQILPLVYDNKKIFSDAGVEVPTTWAAFTDAVAKLKAAGVTPIELAGAEPWSAVMPLTATVSTDVLGPDPKWIQERDAGTVKFTDDNFKGAVQKVADMTRSSQQAASAITDYTSKLCGVTLGVPTTTLPPVVETAGGTP
jgi:multiple sugar transport system substrate-binding protein/raffinose/stachyose/melibiose transport system substrate-binding protein